MPVFVLYADLRAIYSDIRVDKAHTVLIYLFIYFLYIKYSIINIQYYPCFVNKITRLKLLTLL